MAGKAAKAAIAPFANDEELTAKLISIIQKESKPLRKMKGLMKKEQLKSQFESYSWNVRDASDWSLLMWAAYKGYPALTKFLLSKGCDPNYQTRTSSKKSDVVTNSKSESLQRESSQENKGELSTASFLGKCNVLFLVLATLGKNEKEASNRRTDDSNDKKLVLKSILGLPKKDDYLKIAKLLINFENIDLESQTEHGMNPLLLASNYNQIEVAKLLIEKGANVNVVSNFDHTTPLHHAVYNKNYDIVKLLIKEPQIDVNICSFGRGYMGLITPLFWAVRQANDDMDRMIVSLLLQKGALLQLSQSMVASYMHKYPDAPTNHRYSTFLFSFQNRDHS